MDARKMPTKGQLPIPFRSVSAALSPALRPSLCRRCQLPLMSVMAPEYAQSGIIGPNRRTGLGNRSRGPVALVDKARDQVDGSGQHDGPQEVGQQRLPQDRGADGVRLQVSV